MGSWSTARRTLIAAAASSLALAGSGHAAEPRVVASIKPVHSLVAGVMAGIGAPFLLIKGAGSPHSYSLRPSEAEALENADVVFWIGEGLETFLSKPLAAIPKRSNVVALAAAPGVSLLEGRKGGVWDSQADKGEEHREDEHGHGDEDGHAHGAYDMHLWLDPENAKAMTRAIATALADWDPANAAAYRANADRELARLDALEAEVRELLAPIRGRPYIVFHDAYQYFERHFDLRPAGAITVSPDRAPGARRLSQIRRKIRDSGTTCVFSEPQFAPGLVRTVIEGTPARTAALDPLGVAVPPGPDAYGTLMRDLARAMRACLEPSG